MAELLLRGAVRLQRAAAHFANAREELVLAREEVNKAREALTTAEGGELRAQVCALLAQLTVRGMEALARKEGMAAFSVELESWARRAPAPAASSVPPSAPGTCRLCRRALTTTEALQRGYHANCPEEGHAFLAVAGVGGAP